MPPYRIIPSNEEPNLVCGQKTASREPDHCISNRVNLSTV
ncbi:hypothetical protein BH695_1127 [Microcystis aeruginosa PCC 7806SL]|uniref:Uncharacterized protein n=1 Tax=Microcystis aeruginosa PCC 7806SL TaxID=1903187 RepID=A0AB33BXJ6_MICA7|nr:hypothetical protein BH695_1127 [Microcystis aeruginosa PCC 7806SL]